MKRSLPTLLGAILALVGFPGCAGVSFYKDASLKGKAVGLPVYQPRPHLLVTYPDDSSKPVSVSVVLLPDTNSALYVKQHRGFGTSEFNFTLTNGALSSWGQKADSKATETLTALTGGYKSYAEAAKLLAEKGAITEGPTATAELTAAEPTKTPTNLKEEDLDLLKNVAPRWNTKAETRYPYAPAIYAQADILTTIQSRLNERLKDKALSEETRALGAQVNKVITVTAFLLRYGVHAPNKDDAEKEAKRVLPLLIDLLRSAYPQVQAIRTTASVASADELVTALDEIDRSLRGCGTFLASTLPSPSRPAFELYRINDDGTLKKIPLPG